jgi:hypothetical protein
MTPSDSLGFGLYAFDSLVRIKCFDSEMQDTLNRYIFPPLDRCKSVPDSPDIDVRLEQRADGIHIALNQMRVDPGETARDAVLATVKALDEAIVQRLQSMHAIHAGAVLVEGRALLLPGSSHAGKSSLVAELLRRGASCFSDEYALIDSNGYVHPYPRPLLLRQGRPRQTLVLPEELNSRFAMVSVPVGWIVATEFVSGGDWKVRPRSQSEAVMLLLSNTPHTMEQSPHLLEICLRAVGEAKCFSGKRGDAAQAAEEILQLVAASPSRC